MQDLSNFEQWKIFGAAHNDLELYMYNLFLLLARPTGPSITIPITKPYRIGPSILLRLRFQNFPLRFLHFPSSQAHPTLTLANYNTNALQQRDKPPLSLSLSLFLSLSLSLSLSSLSLKKISFLPLSITATWLRSSCSRMQKKSRS